METQRVQRLLGGADALRRALTLAKTGDALAVALSHLAFCMRLRSVLPVAHSPASGRDPLAVDLPDLPLPDSVKRRCRACAGNRYPQPPNSEPVCLFCSVAARLCALLIIGGYRLLNDDAPNQHATYASCLRLNQPPLRCDVTDIINSLVNPVYSSYRPHTSTDAERGTPAAATAAVATTTTTAAATAATAALPITARTVDGIALHAQFPAHLLPPAESIIGLHADQAHPAVSDARLEAQRVIQHTFLTTVAPRMLRRDDAQRQQQAHRQAAASLTPNTTQRIASAAAAHMRRHAALSVSPAALTAAAAASPAPNTVDVKSIAPAASRPITSATAVATSIPSRSERSRTHHAARRKRIRICTSDDDNEET